MGDTEDGNNDLHYLLDFSGSVMVNAIALMQEGQYSNFVFSSLNKSEHMYTKATKQDSPGPPTNFLYVAYYKRLIFGVTAKELGGGWREGIEGERR